MAGTGPTHAWGKAPFHNHNPKQSHRHCTSSADDQLREPPWQETQSNDRDNSGGWEEAGWTTQTSGKKVKAYEMPAAWATDAAPTNGWEGASDSSSMWVDPEGVMSALAKEAAGDRGGARGRGKGHAGGRRKKRDDPDDDVKRLEICKRPVTVAGGPVVNVLDDNVVLRVSNQWHQTRRLRLPVYTYMRSQDDSAYVYEVLLFDGRRLVGAPAYVQHTAKLRGLTLIHNDAWGLGTQNAARLVWEHALQEGAWTVTSELHRNDIDIALLPGTSAKCVKVEVADTVEACEAWLDKHVFNAKEPCTLVGIDTEWTNAKRNSRLGTIQMSTGTHALVLQARGIEDLPKGMRRLLETSSIFKCAVNIGMDASMLRERYGTIVMSGIDLAELAREAFGISGSIGLADLATRFLGVFVNKAQDIRCSNWTSSSLSADQVAYAAMDACLHREVGVQMLRRVLGQAHRASGNGDAEGVAEAGESGDVPPSEATGFAADPALPASQCRALTLVWAYGYTAADFVAVDIACSCAGEQRPGTASDTQGTSTQPDEEVARIRRRLERLTMSPAHGLEGRDEADACQVCGKGTAERKRLCDLNLVEDAVEQ